MVDYNKLEQLGRLRDNGALSWEEFEREKAKLLGVGEGGACSKGAPATDRLRAVRLGWHCDIFLRHPQSRSDRQSN
ncbi:MULTISPECIES: SHOCT domain-containing protein [Novosphingobium]|uniref:SHOCT domain-containing protein n=1 Tax=Novosphingobium TaxID=165696 RepID=UPI0035169986